MKRVFALASLTLALVAAEPMPTVTIDIKNRPLVEAVAALANQARLHLVADGGMEDVLGQHILLQVADRPWAEVVAQLREHGLAVQVDGQVLHVRSAEAEERSRYRMKIYDIRALTRGMTMYPGPDLDIPEPGGMGSMLLPPIADDAPPELEELAHLLMEQVHPKSWDGGIAGIAGWNGYLTVTQTPEVLADIDQFFQAHERLIGRQVVCEIREIAAPADVRPTVDAEVAKKLLAQARTVASFVCENGAQNHHFSGRNEQIIADANRVQSTFDPIVSVIAEGILVDVQPVLTIGGTLATIRFAEVAGSRRGQARIRDQAGVDLVAIDTVDQDQVYCKDQRLIPPGGAALYMVGERCYALTFTAHGGP